MNKLIDLLKKLKATGIIIDCWEMIINQLNYEYNKTNYDDEYFGEESVTKNIINCKGEIKKYRENVEINYEYNKHRYDLSETMEINES